MALTLWRQRNTFEGLTRCFDDPDTWFEDYLLTEKFGKWAPAVDIEEKDGTYMVKADLPGLKKGDIHLELNDMPPFFINLAEKNQD